MVVGSSAGIVVSKPISRSARTGFGPRVILRVAPSALRSLVSRCVGQSRAAAAGLHPSSTQDRHTLRPRTGAATPLQVPRRERREWRSLGRDCLSAALFQHADHSVKLPSFRHYNSPTTQLFRHLGSLRLNHPCRDLVKTTRPCRACPPSPSHLAAARALQ